MTKTSEQSLHTLIGQLLNDTRLINDGHFMSKLVYAHNGTSHAVCAPKWISVKDSLPSEGQEVIAWSEKTGFEDVCLGEEEGCGYWYRDVDGQITSFPLESATHWMPLPEKPEGL